MEMKQNSVKAPIREPVEPAASTRSKTKSVEYAGPAGIVPDLAAILDGQAKMQQELADLKKRSADEMEALRQENSRFRRKIEADPTLKEKAKEVSEAARSLAFQPTEEESEYNPTPHTFTTTQQTPIPSTHPTHFPSTQPGHTAAPTPAATLPTTQISYNMPTTLHTTHVPPYNPQYLPTTHIPAMINHPIPPHLLPPRQPRRRHPFTDFIANTPLPAQWEPFTLDRYSGKIDPDEHLKVYITHVALYTSQGETNNPNQHGNYKEDHRLVTSSINRCETANSAEKRYALDNCFNNKDDGDQDYSNCEIIGCSMAKDCYNNEASGLQDLSQANLNISESENCFNNKSSKSQTYRRAKIGNPNDPNFAIRNTYNNEKNGAQNRDDYKYLPRGNIMNEHQSPN